MSDEPSLEAAAGVVVVVVVVVVVAVGIATSLSFVDDGGDNENNGNLDGRDPACSM